MSETKYKIVLVRHGESVWNEPSVNRFTGWADVDLSEKGLREAKQAGQWLKENNFQFDVAFTSVLKRAIRTLWIILDTTDQMFIPVTRSWRLNERMYGSLTALNKSETAEKHGEDQVKIWRRSYDIPPPPVDESSEYWPGNDRRYKDLKPEEIPKAESLKLTVERVVPFWNSDIVPAVKSGKRVVVAAHGNTLRALVKHLDNVPESSIVELNIPTGIPLVYELDADLKPVKHYYLADEETVRKALETVANQGKAAPK